MISFLSKVNSSFNNFVQFYFGSFNEKGFYNNFLNQKHYNKFI